MNPVVGARANSYGMLSPTPAQRYEVQQKLLAPLKAPQILPKGLGMKMTAPTQKQSSGATDGTRVPDQELSRDAFLQLLVLQMQNQDPVNPVDNTEMVSQLAEFSALEQMTNLNDSFQGMREDFANMSGNMDQLNFITANALIGRTVEGFNNQGEFMQGTVDRVHMDGSLVFLGINDQLMSMAGVVSIQDEVK